MILYLKSDSLHGVDVYSFAPLDGAIHCPGDLWFACISASLKRKYSVFILENWETPHPHELPDRWCVSENYCWLSPRSLSVIWKAYEDKPMNFQEFKEFLKTSK